MTESDKNRTNPDDPFTPDHELSAADIDAEFEVEVEALEDHLNPETLGPAIACISCISCVSAS